MAEFKVGDKVVRKDNFQHGAWELECARNDKSATEVFTVTDYDAGWVWLEGHTAFWDVACFRLATGLEEHQDSALPAEDRLRESDAHIECLRDLLDTEKRRVSELQAAVQELEARVTDINRIGVEFCDQRDAAVAAAKSLGEEVQALRQDRRSLRLGFHSLDGLFGALNAGLADIDFGLLRSQLNLISQMAQEQGNGADAKLCADAYQVVDFVDRALADWRVGQDE